MNKRRGRRSTKSEGQLDIAIGLRIRQSRILRRLAQEALAEKVGLTFQQIQKYEKGTNRVSASRLVAVANALDLPVSFFYDGLLGDRPLDMPTTADWTKRESLELLRNYHGIPAGPLRRTVYDLVKHLGGGGEPDAPVA